MESKNKASRERTRTRRARRASIGCRAFAALASWCCASRARGARGRSCGTWDVARVANVVNGIEIMISGGSRVEEAPRTVWVNGRERCASESFSTTATTATCVIVEANERALRAARDFVREFTSVGRVQVWVASLPPRLIVDATTNTRHALRTMDDVLNATRTETETKEADFRVATTRVYASFTVDDRQYEESAEYKAFVIATSHALDSTSRMRTPIDPPRAGGAEIFRLDLANATKTIEFIDHHRTRSFYRVTCCVSVGRSTFVLSFDDGSECTVRSPSRDPVRHLRGTTNDPCVAKDLSLPYPDDITLEFTPSERATFDEYRGFYRGSYEKMMRAKSKFALAVRFDEGPRLRATARFRGVSSFRDCERRKSLTVELDGRGVRLMPGSFGTKFLLISLCIDDRYVKTHLVLSMAKALGTFPHAFRYVRLKIRTRGQKRVEHSGLYLLMDDPKSSLARAHNQLSVVVRRRFDPARKNFTSSKGVPEVKSYPNTDIEAIAGRVRYERVVLASESCEDKACFDVLNNLIDLEGYLRWMALMTWVESGDYVDELWLYASNENDGKHRFKVHAWDPDDSFESCHHGGEDAIVGLGNLLYCAEGAIDRVLVRSESMRAHYIKILNEVLRDRLNERALREIVDAQEGQIRRLLNDDDTALGLLELREIEPSIDSATEAVSEIIGSLRYYRDVINFRRRSLLRDAEAYASFDPSATAWTSQPTADDCDDGAPTLVTQVRSYDRIDQDILLKVSGNGGSYALNVSFDPIVVYNGSTYVATRDEFVLERWSSEQHENVTRMAMSSPCVRTFIGGGYIVLSSICDDSIPHMFSLHHRFWHGFANASSPMIVSRLLGCV